MVFLVWLQWEHTAVTDNMALRWPSLQDEENGKMKKLQKLKK